MQIVLCMKGFKGCSGRANWEEKRRVNRIIQMFADAVMRQDWFRGEVLFHQTTDQHALEEGTRGVTLYIRPENIRGSIDESFFERKLRAKAKKLSPEEVSVAVLS